MEPLQAIKYVTSGITLVAFIAATIAWAYRARLKSQKQTIQLANPDDRAALVERTLEFFTVDTAGLTPQQKHELALRQIEARAERFRISAKSALLVTCVAAVITLVFLLKGHGQDNRRVTLVRVDGDGASFPLLKYHNFVVKAVDQDGNPVAGVKIEWSTPVGGNKAYVDVTGNEGTSSATNLYTFPYSGLYEQVAAVAAGDTQIGWTTTLAVRVVGPTVKFKYSQEPESHPSGTVCPDGEYREGDSITWTYKHASDTVEIRRSDNGCWATLTLSANNWTGTLRCSNGSSYPVTLMPNNDCTEIPSSLSWFKLHK